MSNQLLPCPFCGGDANAKPHSQHLPGCYFDAMAALKAAPKGDLSMAPEVVRAWNRRATQPAAGEPAAWECVHKGYLSLSYEKEGDPERAVPLFRAAPPAAAHGDEAVRKDATESAIQRACKELPEGWSMQIDLERGAGCVTLFNPWGSVVDFGQDFESIGEEVEAAIAAAMRAQAGEGGE